jgi:protocatechuate 3,4-dioxygenase beta subunit
VKVQGRDTSVLMTQLYFPGESLNAHDWLFDDSLLLKIDESDDRSQHASFDFVLTRRDKV